MGTRRSNALAALIMSAMSAQSAWSQPPEPEAFDFYVRGRPENLYSMAYSGDNRVCSKLLASLNEPRQPIYQRAAMVEAFETRDLILGNAYSIEWRVLSGEPRPIWYSEVADIDGDGDRDALFLFIDRLYGWAGSSLFILEQPLVLGADPDATKARLRMPPNADGHEITITAGSIATDDPAPIASNYDLGSFIDVVTIDHRSYALVGGRLGGRRPKEDIVDVRLLTVESGERQTEICRFHPQFYPAY